MAFHARSISLPSRSQPLTLSIEDQLNRLTASEATSSSSPSEICQNLSSIHNLYESVHNLLELSSIQQAISHESDNKRVRDVLDGSLRLLDICGTMKDVFSQTKACVQDLESSLRRRNSRESCIANEIDKYFISKKNINKTVSKCCANLKRMKKSNLALSEGDSDISAAIGTLREVEAVSLTMFESLLSFTCPVKGRSKSIGQSLVSKFIHSKHASPEAENGFERIDAALGGLNTKHKSNKANETTEMHNVQKGLQALESTTQELEEGLECTFRCLIKKRVSLLNILNH